MLHVTAQHTTVDAFSKEVWKCIYIVCQKPVISKIIFSKLPQTLWKCILQKNNGDFVTPNILVTALLLYSCNSSPLPELIRGKLHHKNRLKEKFLQCFTRPAAPDMKWLFAA